MALSKTILGKFYIKIRAYYLFLYKTGPIEFLINLCKIAFPFIIIKIGLNKNDNTLCLRIKGYPNPVLLRYRTSDSSVFRQIFISKCYSCLDNITDVKFIIDAGAYNGYSPIYFLNKHRKAFVVAIEPDKSNFNICKKNLSYYGNRVVFINSALWPDCVGLSVIKGKYRDGRDWTTQVKECSSESKPDIYSVDIESILKKYNFKTIDILKIDIERSECDLFSKGYEKWLDSVRNIAIELHDEECKEVFFKALSGYNYELCVFDDLTICKNLSRKD